jgi:hypothetical protein
VASHPLIELHSSVLDEPDAVPQSQTTDDEWTEQERNKESIARVFTISMKSEEKR